MSGILEEPLIQSLKKLIKDQGQLVVLTGAGISAESGVPTFRGEEGYWTVGSSNYRPEEMATNAMFQRFPDEVWQWYLYRRGVCNRAEPNPGHRAIVKMEALLKDSFTLITQNVDGIHARAGSSTKRTYEIHGNINRMRCSNECSKKIFPMPEDAPNKSKQDPLTPEDRARLICPKCKGLARPHVLWFDECYDEDFFRFNSSIEAAVKADFLLIVGTSGATNLPMRVGSIAAQKGAVLVDVNPQANPFSRMAEQGNGFFVQAAGGAALTEMVKVMEQSL